MDKLIIDSLCRIHEGLSRKGPGSDALARQLIARIRPLLPEPPVVADLGCGNGYCAYVLAEALGAEVTAVDFCPAFIDELKERLDKAPPKKGHIVPRVADMLTPGLEPESIDLAWSEGAVGSVGVRESLEGWLPLLTPGGIVVFSDLCWFNRQPPEEAQAFFAEPYPGMATVGGQIKAAEELGYTFVHAELLPAADWWTSYFDPLAGRLRELEADVEPGSVLAEVIRLAWVEQENFRRHSDHFGYLFLVLKK
ncbi:class I SAM-dependent methyltransferase [Shumkonia mesophila]|uniref:class I SAM-dependent methyltransferase n=1 Tax=Shumkonia mesophila TaxID=2838854 RepID=UPI00293451DF|nr:class I SAM-dependent methyltransferase [Shumkonia mesophila]